MTQRRGPGIAPPSDRTGGIVLPLGATVEHYEIQTALGSGGLGTVYEALNTRNHRMVAFKLYSVPVNAADGRDFVQRLQVVQSVLHPHLVELVDVGETRGRLWLASERLVGWSLRRALAKGPLPTLRAAQIAAQVCEAVGAGHARGVIHGDIKPSAIFLSTRGSEGDFVKVLDLGVLLALRETNAYRKQLLATPHNASPEHFDDDKLDERSDVYCVGALLYQMLSGRPPFPMPELADVEAAHRSKLPPPMGLADAAGRHLESVVGKALAKAPADRFQTVEELKAAMEAAAERGGREDAEKGSRPIVVSAPWARTQAPEAQLGPSSAAESDAPPQTNATKIDVVASPRRLLPVIAVGLVALIALLAYVLLRR